MPIFNFIIWSPDPDIFNIGGLTVRWYGLLFALGFIIGQQILFYMFKKEGKPEKDVETLTIYMVIATILGARLGHVLFYEPAEYLSDPIRILKIWEGGLASHGAAVGILIALWLYSSYYINITFSRFTVQKKKRKGQSFLWILDRMVIVVALAGALIRFGNFMNSEIIGVPTQSEAGVFFGWDVERLFMIHDAIEGVSFEKTDPAADTLEATGPLVTMTLKFVKGNFNEEALEQFIQNETRKTIEDKNAGMHVALPDNQVIYNLTQEKGHYLAEVTLLAVPRHPAQLYESLSSLILFGLLFWYWRRKHSVLPDGKIFGIFLVVLFSLRFLYEFIKESQVAFEDDLPLKMGQWLSIPLVIAGIVLLTRRKKQNRRE